MSFLSDTGKAPYLSVLTHGFVLDEKGLKMSKSLGNVVDPRLVIEGSKNQRVSNVDVSSTKLVLDLYQIIISLLSKPWLKGFFLPYSQESPAYGADVLRLWVSSVDYTSDVMIGPQILRQMSEVYRKLRGTLRYLLANLHDWKVSLNG